ncbi:component of the polarisome [Umbelopsis nana]
MGTMNIESVDVGYKYQGNSPINSPYSSPKPPYARTDMDMNSSPGSVSSRAESYSSKDGRLNGTSNGSVSSNSRSPAPGKWDNPMPKMPPVSTTNNTNGDTTNFQSLDSLMADLGNMVTKDQSKPSHRDDMNAKSDAARNFDAQMEQLKSDYEYKLNAMRQRIKDLEADATEREEAHAKELKMKEAPKERDTQFTQLQDQYDELEEKYKQMEDDYQQQQEVVNDVRREVTNLLEELKELSRKNDEITIEKEQAQDKLSVVEKESKEWQRKFEKAKTELRNLKATSSFVRQPPKLEVLGDDLLRPTEDGAISQDHVINYQVAVDDLLRSGRSEKPSSVLISMKAVVVSCKTITEDVEAYENDESKDIDAEKKDKLYTMKSQFSKGLSNLMAAAKTHANGMGICPVSLLDAAATHLTFTVVELIKLFGMKFGKGSDRDSVQSLDVASNPVGSPHNSILRKPDSYGTYKPSNARQDTADVPRGLHPDDLAAYLKRQTDQIVQTIQQLLSALRTPSRSEEIAPIITTIVTVVANVVTVSKSSFTTPAGMQFKKDGEMILQDLQGTRSKLMTLRDGHFVKNPLDAPANAKKDLAKESYEVAKFTRELLGIL